MLDYSDADAAAAAGLSVCPLTAILLFFGRSRSFKVQTDVLIKQKMDFGKKYGSNVTTSLSI